MNTNRNILNTEFANLNRFDPAFVPAAPFRGTVENELETLKRRLLAHELGRAAGVDANVYLRRAANDAAALAWLTPYPLLVMPVLFEEKVRESRKHAGRAAMIRARSTDLLSLAE
jgi:hypothetical protein